MGYIDRSDDASPDGGEFADYFEWDGPRWLYYRRGWMAPVAVTEEEYNRALQKQEKGGFVVVGLLLLLAAAIYFVPTMWKSDWPGRVEFIVIIVVLLILSEFGQYANSRMAARDFAGRPPVGPPRDRNFMKRRRLAQLSWKVLFGWMLVMASLLAASLAFTSGSYFWVGYVLVLTLSLYVAHQKWRFERRSATPTSA